MKGIQKKCGTKTIEEIWERIGRLKEKYPNSRRFFDIQTEHDVKKATSMTWKRITSSSRKEGVCFLKTSLKDIRKKNNRKKYIRKCSNPETKAYAI